jgi:predicted GTPase
LRAGNEITHFPGEVNLRIADVVIINKVDSATPEQVEAVRKNIVDRAPKARIIEAESPVTVDDERAIAGKRVLVVEDGPTLTHGNMAIGAGYVAAVKYGAAEIVDPKPYARGSIKEAYVKYPHLKDIVPALGYSTEQLRELEDTINAVPCDAVIIGTPINLARELSIVKPAVRVLYSLKEREPGILKSLVLGVFEDKIEA